MLIWLRPWARVTWYCSPDCEQATKNYEQKGGVSRGSNEFRGYRPHPRHYPLQLVIFLHETTKDTCGLGWLSLRANREGSSLIHGATLHRLPPLSTTLPYRAWAHVCRVGKHVVPWCTILYVEGSTPEKGATQKGQFYEIVSTRFFCLIVCQGGGFVKIDHLDILYIVGVVDLFQICNPLMISYQHRTTCNRRIGNMPSCSLVK
jgi:hypothetical protein